MTNEEIYSDLKGLKESVGKLQQKINNGIGERLKRMEAQVDKITDELVEIHKDIAILREYRNGASIGKLKHYIFIGVMVIIAVGVAELLPDGAERIANIIQSLFGRQ